MKIYVPMVHFHYDFCEPMLPGGGDESWHTAKGFKDKKKAEEVLRRDNGSTTYYVLEVEVEE